MSQSIREINANLNSRGKDIRPLFIVDYIDMIKPAKGKSHIRLRLIRTGRIRKIMKKI